jgi:SAM-dependent methyltransferase
MRLATNEHSTGCGRTSMRPAIRLLCVVALLSCRSVPSEGRADGSAQARPIDEAAVKAMTHALFDAYDRADEDAFARAIGPAFVSIEDTTVRERDVVLSDIRARRGRKEPVRTRAPGHEQVWIGPDSTVFIGESVEHIPPGARFTGDYDGTSTLVWVRDGRDGAVWKAAMWHWAKAGLDATRDEWNLTYLYSLLGKSPTATGHYNMEPNRFLVEMVKGRKPGRALDISMGQGRNALYLASQGWQVTGIDISDEALREAREAAAARKLVVEMINADEATWDYGIDRWDLLVMTYGGCGDNRIEDCRRSLKRGGLVVGEFFHKDANPRIGVATGELSASFKDGFKVLREDTVEDVSDWGNQKDPEKLVRFAAEKL